MQRNPVPYYLQAAQQISAQSQGAQIPQVVQHLAPATYLLTQPQATQYPPPNGDTSRATIRSAHAGCAVRCTRPYCAVSVSDAGYAVSVSDAGCAAVSSDAGCAAVSSSDTACTINSSDAVYIVQSCTVNTDKQPNLLCEPGGALELWRSELRTSRCRRIRYGYPDYLPAAVTALIKP